MLSLRIGTLNCQALRTDARLAELDTDYHTLSIPLRIRQFLGQQTRNKLLNLPSHHKSRSNTRCPNSCRNSKNSPSLWPHVDQLRWRLRKLLGKRQRKFELSTSTSCSASGESRFFKQFNCTRKAGNTKQESMFWKRFRGQNSYSIEPYSNTPPKTNFNSWIWARTIRWKNASQFRWNRLRTCPKAHYYLSKDTSSIP